MWVTTEMTIFPSTASLPVDPFDWPSPTCGMIQWSATTHQTAHAVQAHSPFFIHTNTKLTQHADSWLTGGHGCHAAAGYNSPLAPGYLAAAQEGITPSHLSPNLQRQQHCRHTAPNDLRIDEVGITPSLLQLDPTCWHPAVVLPSALQAPTDLGIDDGGIPPSPPLLDPTCRHPAVAFPMRSRHPMTSGRMRVVLRRATRARTHTADS